MRRSHPAALLRSADLEVWKCPTSVQLQSSDSRAVSLQPSKIIVPPVAEMGQSHVVDTSANVVDPSRVAAIPTCQHLLDDLALQVVLRTTEIAGNDWVLTKI